MASWSFFEGKTVDVALKNAAKELGVPIDKLEYEIVFSGASGIFGLVGAKNAKIRVATPPGSSIASSDAITDMERQEILSLVDETFADTGSSLKETRETKAPKAPKAHKEFKAPKLPPKAEAFSESREPCAPSAEELEPEPEPEQNYTEADFEAGKTALSKIVENIVSEAKISVEIKNNQVFFNLEGDNAAKLIGKHGQTLKAMQHLVEKIIQKSCGERVRVMVDVEQYMEKRRATLKSLATKLADKDKQTGKPTTINRMDAFERKIIHDTLRKDKHVKTRSAGGGEIRNIVIHPGKKGGRPKKASGK